MPDSLTFMMGKFAAVLGPFLMGITALVTGSSRQSLLSLVILFVVGDNLLKGAAFNTVQIAERLVERGLLGDR